MCARGASVLGRARRAPQVPTETSAAGRARTLGGRGVWVAGGAGRAACNGRPGKSTDGPAAERWLIRVKPAPGAPFALPRRDGGVRARRWAKKLPPSPYVALTEGVPLPML